jgi:hypothetical protein
MIGCESSPFSQQAPEGQSLPVPILLRVPWFEPEASEIVEPAVVESTCHRLPVLVPSRPPALRPLDLTGGVCGIRGRIILCLALAVGVGGGIAWRWLHSRPDLSQATPSADGRAVSSDTGVPDHSAFASERMKADTQTASRPVRLSPDIVPLDEHAP